MATVHNLRFPFMLVTILGCGLVAGVFFAFSTFVMPALARLQPPQGIVAMQSLNITAINPLFMIALFGTALACLFLAVFVLFKWQQPGSVYLLVGSLLYLVGTIGGAIAFNVPLNNALAIVKPDSAEGATLWARYLTDWTFWNHVRTIAALVAAAFFTLEMLGNNVIAK
ncbi:MAG: DUF1772 domain-containing protein [Phormidium tanganyikae FI6-MK23]|jgi:uncharacterized membrane protein|nr:DUF1772 domain-containing protein [Phormidium tanganyikae FI6-MK23]